MADQIPTPSSTKPDATPDPVVTDAVVPGAPKPVVEPAPPETPPAPPVKTYTKAEVEEIVKTRLSRERNEKLQTPSAPVEPAKPVKAKTSTPKTPAEPSSSEYRAFDRAIGKFEHLTDRQLEHVEGEFLRVRPAKADTATFIADLVEGLFPAPKQETTQPKASDATTKPPAADKEPGVKADPNAIDNNAPGTQTTWQQVTDPSLLSAEMIAQIINEKGLRSGQRYIRNMGERWGKTVRVTPG